MILDEVITRLVTMFAAAVDVPVYDGLDFSAANRTDFLLVGSAGEDEEGATVEETASTLGPGTWRDETGEVVCSSWSWSGGQNLAPRRAAAGAAAAACVEAVAADRTLDGLLEAYQADVSDIRYRPLQSDKGAGCRFAFTVTYRTLNT